MTTKKLILSLLATFVTLTLAGTVMASDIGTEAGNFEFNFEQQLNPELQRAVSNHVYNPKLLAAIGTESGAWNVNYVDPKALEAAKSHEYDSSHLQAVGTEAGDYDVFEQKSSPHPACILC